MATAQNPFDINAKPTAAGPTAMQVNKNSTTAGQLEGLLAGDSPYIAQARARASQQSNARGLINSTMGIQAGEAAAINAAMPIAQSDAAAYFNADQFNANNQNQFTRDENMFNRDDYMQEQQRDFTAGQASLDRQQQTSLQESQQQFQGTQAGLDRQQQTSLQNSQQQFQGSQAGLDRQQQLTLQQGDQSFRGQQAGLDREQQLTLQNIDANTRVQLGNIEADYKQLLQSSSNASSIYTEISKNIGAIQTNTSLNADTKTKLVTEQINLLRNAFVVQGALANLNLVDLIPDPQKAVNDLLNKIV